MTRFAQSAVVNEAIRLSHGPIFRSTRVAPTEYLTYKGLVIPPGVRNQPGHKHFSFRFTESTSCSRQ